ncbi:unnamed protein product [Citrullus colocynthis]|uniref:Uncharacterized protein n=1 Tax=Citrullus colocynthis TaxID=252529 RepID=A0ABP0XRM8_9ROSI
MARFGLQPFIRMGKKTVATKRFASFSLEFCCCFHSIAILFFKPFRHCTDLMFFFVPSSKGPVSESAVWRIHTKFKH